jgi:hypothetical protein
VCPEFWRERQQVLDRGLVGAGHSADIVKAISQPRHRDTKHSHLKSGAVLRVYRGKDFLRGHE